jgi:hypothetical protein
LSAGYCEVIRTIHVAGCFSLASGVGDIAQTVIGRVRVWKVVVVRSVNFRRSASFGRGGGAGLCGEARRCVDAVGRAGSLLGRVGLRLRDLIGARDGHARPTRS